MFSNGNLKTPPFSILNFQFARNGRQWRSMTAATGRCGRGARGVGDAAPYGREGPGFVIARAGTARGNPFPPSPFSMFSNGNLKTPQLFILHFSFPSLAGQMWRAMLAATGRCGREARGVEDAAPYGGKVPVLSLRDQSADWSWQSASPSPFSKFSNGNL